MRALSIAILSFALCLLAPSVGHAQITVDGDASEWTGAAPSVNSSTLSSNTAGAGANLDEYIWNDASGDNRTDFDGANGIDASKQDIEEVRLASDGSNLYYLLQLPDNVNVMTGNGGIQFQVSLDRGGGTNQEYLAANSDALVPSSNSPGGSVPDARWEYLFLTKTGSQTGDNKIWQNGYSGSTTAGSYAVNASKGVIEGRVPWSEVGGAPGNSDIVMTFSIYRTDGSGGAYDASRSDCLDYATPTSGNTYNALIQQSSSGQGRLDHAETVPFQNDGILPVELTAFDARKNGMNAVLSWKTTSETNNSGFVVQHAVGGGPFEKAGWVDGAGTTTETQDYHFSLEGLSAGTHRFRLKQVDRDGTTSYSETVSLAVQPQGPVAVQAAPHPVQQTSTVRLTAKETGSVTVALYDLLGRRVETLHQGRVAANQPETFSVRASSLAAGTYFLRVRGESFTQTKRITVAR